MDHSPPGLFTPEQLNQIQTFMAFLAGQNNSSNQVQSNELEQKLDLVFNQMKAKHEIDALQ
jgi:hypothetical protein